MKTALNIWFGLLILATAGTYAAAVLPSLQGQEQSGVSTVSITVWTTLLLIEWYRRKNMKLWQGLLVGVSLSFVVVVTCVTISALNIRKTPQGFADAEVRAIQQQLPVVMDEVSSIVSARTNNKAEIVYLYRINKARFGHLLVADDTTLESKKQYDELAVDYGYQNWEELLHDYAMQSRDGLLENYCENPATQGFRDFNIKLMYTLEWENGDYIGDVSMLASEDCLPEKT
jgi:hypothetical protein